MSKLQLLLDISWKEFNILMELPWYLHINCISDGPCAHLGTWKLVMLKLEFENLAHKTFSYCEVEFVTLNCIHNIAMYSCYMRSRVLILYVGILFGFLYTYQIMVILTSVYLCVMKNQVERKVLLNSWKVKVWSLQLFLFQMMLMHMELLSIHFH